VGFCPIHTVISQGLVACKWHGGRGQKGEFPTTDVDYFVSHLVPKPKA